MRAALVECERRRAETKRLLAERDKLIREYRAIVEDAGWFAVMAQRDIEIPAPLPSGLSG
jgi:hypothetical protein